MKTFFALVNIPKAQQVGSKVSITTTKKAWVNPLAMAEPQYTTTQAVTEAIANGTFVGSSIVAYDLAKKWQLYLKSLEAKKFFKKGQKGNPNNKAYNHTFQFTH